jgi:hypothetical protein
MESLGTQHVESPQPGDQIQVLLRLLSYLVFTRLAYASYLPYLYDRTVSTVYRTHFGLCRYLDT